MNYAASQATMINIFLQHYESFLQVTTVFSKSLPIACTYCFDLLAHDTATFGPFKASNYQ